mmetsp:Transcript_34572/g.42282  ORF Transcript_34572/g.42282 Transcript_34572/m.42282 type:complete len:97 (-) Transcript_34572:1128-1418(-)
MMRLTPSTRRHVMNLYQKRHRRAIVAPQKYATNDRRRVTVTRQHFSSSSSSSGGTTTITSSSSSTTLLSVLSPFQIFQTLSAKHSRTWNIIQQRRR